MIAQANNGYVSTSVRQYVSTSVRQQYDPDFIRGSVTCNLNASDRDVIFAQSGTP